jgi:ribosomal protein S18 acetylase RimI-like enzyme
MKITIRRANKGDAQQLENLVSSLSHFYLSPNVMSLPHWLSTSLQLDQFEARLESAEFTNIVAEIDDCIVGYISIQGNSHLYHLFVSQKHQRRGIARTLWAEALKTCPSLEYTVRSSVYAIPIYTSFGFTATESIREKDGIKYQLMKFIV